MRRREEPWNRLPGGAPLSEVRPGRIRLGMTFRGLAWRARHVRRRAAERGARALLRLAVRLPWPRRLPHRALITVERLVLQAVDDARFDAPHYLARNPDVQEAGIDPLTHYLAFGWAEGRNPAPWFDEALYRRQAGLGPGDRVSGLAHWLAIGRAQGVGPAKGAAGRRPVRCPVDEAAEATAALARMGRLTPAVGAAEVDVIVPVYGGRAETLRCLASVLEAVNATPFALVVIDDCGPDARLRADLARLARRGLIELVVQPENLGLVAAINRGMRLHGGRDVVWLNADTEVSGDWLDRLRRAAYASGDVATVTPLTNNGTICSYPRFDADNCAPLEVTWDEIDRIAARVNAGRTVEAPTCVGFAAYVRRDAIARVGMLDEVAFGRGYGEENDFSRRAVKAGLRNLIAGDVFVRHLGQISFGAERAGLVEAALTVVERRHPGYHRTVRRFIAEDPVAPLRRAIDLERLRRAGSPRHNVLVVTHSLGGGTQQHVEEDVGKLAEAGKGVVLLTGGAGGARTVRLSHPQVAELPALASLTLDGPELAGLLGALGVTEARIHHLADFGAVAAGRFSALMQRLGLVFDFIVHDYLAVCPRINLADRGGMYCGEPGEAGCRRCLTRRRSDFGAPDIRRWRAQYAALLGRTRQVQVPDRDGALRLARYFPDLANIVVRPHQRLRLPQPSPPRRRPGPLRIATIGAIGPIKGFDTLLGLAAEIRAREAAAEIAVIGYTRNDAAARAVGIRVSGRYRNEDAAAEIAREAPDLILLASTWPETYCYTLSHALESGRPVAAFDIGALGTRMRDAAAQGAPCTLLPLELARDPAALLAALLSIRVLEAGQAMSPAPEPVAIAGG